MDILEFVHSIIRGPLEFHSLGESLYFDFFVADISSHVFVYLIRSKTEVSEVFSVSKYIAETLFCKNLKILRSDDGAEYTWYEM